MISTRDSFTDLTSKARVVVAVVAIGNDELYSYTIPTIEAWCKLHHHQLEVIRGSAPFSSPYWAKFKPYELYSKYNADCVILLDADMLIKPGSPTPASLRPRTGIHALNSVSISPGMKPLAKQQQERYQLLYSSVTGVVLPLTEHYINGGLCVVWRDAADFFQPPIHESIVQTGPDGMYDDQNLMNARTFERYTELPQAFNFGHPQYDSNLKRMKDCDVWFLHLNTPYDKVAMARSILQWPCFSRGCKQWWLRHRITASLWIGCKVALLKLCRWSARWMRDIESNLRK